MVKGIYRWFKKNKSYMYVLITIVLMFTFLVNVLFTVQLKYENLGLVEDIAELENRLKSTHQELERSRTDIYIHQEASERLGLTKNDETPIKITVVNEIEETNDEDEDHMNERKIRVFIQEWYKDIKKLTNK